MDQPAGAADAPRTIVVVPCFNEAHRLRAAAFVAHAESDPRTHFLLVDDGSTDGTLACLRELAASCGPVAVLGLPRNVGKAEAVRRGVLAALERRPTYVGYWDADLSTPLAEIGRFAAILHAEPQLLLVMGARVQLLGRDIVRSAARHYAGRVFATVASMVLRLPVYDTQCGAKLFRVTERTPELFAEPFASRWIFDVEILARLMDAGIGDPMHVVYECAVDQWHDVPGSKVAPLDFLRAAVELARLVRRYGPGIARMRR